MTIIDVFSFRLVACGNVKLQMTTEEDIQASDIQEVNGDEDGDTHEHEEQSTTSTTSEPTARRSRFFRSRRKQRLNEEQSTQAETHTDQPDKSNNTSESPRKLVRSPIFRVIYFCRHMCRTNGCRNIYRRTFTSCCYNRINNQETFLFSTASSAF